MAASDYGLAATPGKIPSNQERLSLELERLPKIISEVKKARPEIFLVGFKLLMDTPPDRLIDAAFRSMLRDGQDLAVANAAAGEINVEKIITYLVTKEKGIVPVPRAELPAILLRSIESTVFPVALPDRPHARGAVAVARSRSQRIPRGRAPPLAPGALQSVLRRALAKNSGSWRSAPAREH